jgi:FixJ family two-component response regulator
MVSRRRTHPRRTRRADRRTNRRSRRRLVERALEAGAVAHVLKPFHETHLVGTLTGVLGERAEAEAEADRRHHLLMIESMLRDGHSEHEIIAALEGDR